MSWPARSGPADAGVSVSVPWGWLLNDWAPLAAAAVPGSPVSATSRMQASRYGSAVTPAALQMAVADFRTDGGSPATVTIWTGKFLSVNVLVLCPAA